MSSTQRFETGISENNLKHWGELHSVKEFLQNVVYAKSVLNDEISIKWEKGRAIMSNSPSGFTKGKLLIGESEQADVSGAPGQYGEGMKVAMAVARRCGMECKVFTNGFTVQPELEPSSLDSSVNSLVFYIEDNDTYSGIDFLSDGTTFIVECSEEIFEEAKTYFAVLQGLDPERTKHDSLMTDFKGIFSNGVKITDTPSVYGYNFTSAELINRDRSTVDMSKVYDSTRAVLGTIEDEEVITKIVSGIVEDDSLLESQSGMAFTLHHRIWKKVVAKLFGKKVALATGTGSDTQARYRGFKLLKSIPRGWANFFTNYLEIMPSNELRETTVGTNKHKKATPEENKNLGWAKRLVKLYYGDYGTVKVSETVLDGYGNPCYGLYDTEKDIIWLRRDILSSKKKVFTTLLHETIHRVSGALDNTERFTREWENACWGILCRGDESKYE